MNAFAGAGVGAAVGNVDPTGVKLAGTGLKAVSGVAIAGAGSEDEGTGAQAVCAGAVCAGPGVGGTGAKSPCTGVNARASVDATGGNVDPTGVKPATGLKAVSGADAAGFRSEDEGTGAQAVCTGAVCAGPGVGGTGAKSPCTGVNAPASVDATGGNVDPTGVKPGTGLKAVSGADAAGFRSEDEGTGAQAACTGTDAAGAGAGTFVPHPPQKIAVSFNAEPQLPQNLAIVFLLHGSSTPLVHLLADELPVYSRVNSTRRLRARPSRVSLVSMGCDAPNPLVDRRSGAIWYCVTSACLTAAARRFERSRL